MLEISNKPRSGRSFYACASFLKRRKTVALLNDAPSIKMYTAAAAAAAAQFSLSPFYFLLFYSKAQINLNAQSTRRVV